MNGNALGPVIFIVLGIALGYLILTGRTGNLVAVFQGGATTAAPGNAAGTGTGTGNVANGVLPYAVQY